MRRTLFPTFIPHSENNEEDSELKCFHGQEPEGEKNPKSSFPTQVWDMDERSVAPSASVKASANRVTVKNGGDNL